MNPMIPLWLSLLFEGLTLFLLGYAYQISPREHRTKVLLGIGLWLGLQTILGLAGFYQNFATVPPRMMLMLVPPLLLILFIGFTSVFDRWIKALSWQALTYVQSFRVVMEIILWQLYVSHVIPIQMSFEGRNWDILVGLTAIPVIALYRKGLIREKGLLLWNLFGLGLLINIVGIALTSTPTVLRLFHNEPANTLIAWFPFVWLPSFVVPMALFLHVLSFRKYKLTRAAIHLEPQARELERPVPSH